MSPQSLALRRRRFGGGEGGLNLSVAHSKLKYFELTYNLLRFRLVTS